MAFLGYPRHLSKFVKSFLSALMMRFTDRPQCFSQCFPRSYRSTERGAALNERGQVRVFIVSNSVLPATKYDADPFESQGWHGLMVLHCSVLRGSDRFTATGASRKLDSVQSIFAARLPVRSTPHTNSPDTGCFQPCVTEEGKSF